MNSQTIRWILFLQAVLAVAWSLYFSNFGDPIGNLAAWSFFGWVWFEPCHLCRWSRIMMYNIVFVWFMWVISKDTNSRKYSIIQSVIWFCIASYHISIQQLNVTNAFNCNPSNPCTTIDWHYGFVTIPVLAATAFLAITICNIILYKKSKNNI